MGALPAASWLSLAPQDRACVQLVGRGSGMYPSPGNKCRRPYQLSLRLLSALFEINDEILHGLVGGSSSQPAKYMQDILSHQEDRVGSVWTDDDMHPTGT